MSTSRRLLTLLTVLAGAGCGPAQDPDQPAHPGGPLTTSSQSNAWIEEAPHDPYEATGAPGASEPAPALEPPAPPANATAEPEPAPEPAPASEPPKQAGAGFEPGGRLAGIVSLHNEFRARHCAPPLTWSKELAQVAQRWANKLRDSGCAFEHNPNTRFGENLSFFSPAGSGSPERVVGGWYAEVKDYNFRSPRFDFNTGHFTQVVWAGTTEIGCGMAECSNAELWVCNYNPPGNIQRQYAANVMPTSCSK